MNYAITGKLGTGKSLFCVMLIQDKLRAGCKVATNLNIWPEHLLPARSRQTIHRLPDHPTAEDLDAIGNANPSYDETKNGLLVLDECSHYLNARSWNDKGRLAFIQWLTHARKLGWDVMMIVQDVDMIDSMVRTALLEITVRQRNLSRQSIPFGIGSFARSLGMPSHLPRFHIATGRYGTDPTAPVAERWTYRGTDLFPAFDTKQTFGQQDAAYTILSPWHIKGRYLPKRRPLWHWPFLLIWYLAEKINAAIQGSIGGRSAGPAPYAMTPAAYPFPPYGQA